MCWCFVSVVKMVVAGMLVSALGSTDGGGSGRVTVFLLTTLVLYLLLGIGVGVV